MNEDEIKFVVSAYDYSKRAVGEKFSFIAGDKADIQDAENALKEHLYLTLEEHQEEL